MSGDVIAVGAALDDEAGTSSGAVYVYGFDGLHWADEQKLVASDGARGNFFGAAVSVADDVIVVGSQWDDGATPDTGAAHVYGFDGMEWVEEQKIVASDAETNDVFGTAVSVSGDLIVVGACQENGTGAVYVFRFDGMEWVEEQKIVAIDAAPGDHFGCAVSVSGTRIVIGAPGDTAVGANSGSAYVFRYVVDTGDFDMDMDTTEMLWLQHQRLTASDAAAGDLFGSAVSMSGNRIVVGAYADDAPAADRGSAYVYGFNGVVWVQQQKLVASDGAAGDSFGTVVTVTGDTIVVGAYLDDDAGPGSNSGSAYVYGFTGVSWVEEQKLVASDAAAGDLFGIAVSASADAIVVGAQYDDDAGPDSGSAYVYAFDGADWFEEQKLVAFDDAGD